MFIKFFSFAFFNYVRTSEQIKYFVNLKLAMFCGKLVRIVPKQELRTQVRFNRIVTDHWLVKKLNFFKSICLNVTQNISALVQPALAESGKNKI